MQGAFTKEQATEICEDFEDLTGTELVIRTDMPVKCEIDAVCMVPFDETSRKAFAEAYLSSGDAVQALAAYTGNLFDVMIISHSLTNQSEVIFQTIREYINANGVRYNFPE